MSIRRERACAGVATEKGFGAEGRSCARTFLALRRIFAVLSQKCGELSKPRKFAAFWWLCGQEYALWRTPAFQI